jgi:hypothetical protein
MIKDYQTTLAILGFTLLAACQMSSNRGEHSTATNTTHYPYQKDHSFQWIINQDPKNALVALNAIKAKEKPDTVAMGKC